MKRVPLERAYPGLAFRRRSRNLWARFTGAPAECIHLDQPQPWVAMLVPDTLYVRGKAVLQRRPPRPEASLCLDCLVSVVRPELAAFHGRIVAFEPDPEIFSQYFFMAASDFAASGLRPEVSAAIGQRFSRPAVRCESCTRTATWQWIPRDQVSNLDDLDAIVNSPGHDFCAAHGAVAFCESLEAIPETNIFYMNLPYGPSGAYVWI